MLEQGQRIVTVTKNVGDIGAGSEKGWQCDIDQKCRSRSEQNMIHDSLFPRNCLYTKLNMSSLVLPNGWILQGEKWTANMLSLVKKTAQNQHTPSIVKHITQSISWVHAASNSWKVYCAQIHGTLFQCWSINCNNTCCPHVHAASPDAWVLNHLEACKGWTPGMVERSQVCMVCTPQWRFEDHNKLSALDNHLLEPGSRF